MKYQTECPEWIYFRPTFSTSFYVEKAGYFDERPQIHTSITQLLFLITIPILVISVSLWFLLLCPLLLFGWGRLCINLPIKTGIQDCESAAWGLNFHDDRLWIYIGGGGNSNGGKKCKTITMPWYMEWVRTSKLRKDGAWETEDYKSREKDLWNSSKWKDILWEGDYPYTYKLKSGEIQERTATISIEEREWRWKAFKWLSYFGKIRRSISVRFSDEVGEGTGSWKGGTTGCGYEMLPDESGLECLRRMERERKFN